MIRVSIHFGFGAIKICKYRLNSVPIPNKGDFIIIDEKEIFSFIGCNEKIKRKNVFQFIVKNIDYRYDDDDVYIYINLSMENEIDNKSSSI